MFRSLLAATITVSAALNFALPARADGRRDLYFQEATKQYFNFQQNARTFAMGGSSVDVSSDSSSVVGNPAGLGLMKDADFSATYSRDTISGNEHPSYRDVEDKTDIGSGLIAIPLNPVLDDLPDSGNLGLGWSGYDSEWDDDSFNTEADGYSIIGAYAKALSPTFSIGYSFAYFHADFENDLFSYPMVNGYRHTLGLQQRAHDNFTWGATAFVGHGTRDIHTPFASEESDLLEIGTSFGVGLNVTPSTLLTAGVDYQYYEADGDLDDANPAIVFGGDEEGHVFNVRAGVEQTLNDMFKLRAGYRYGGLNDYDFDRTELDDLNGSAKYNAFSAGAGISIPVGGRYLKAINIDYGAEYRAVGDDDWQHVVTVSFPTSFCGDAA